MANLFKLLAHWPDIVKLVKDEEGIRVEIQEGKQIDLADGLKDLEQTAQDFNLPAPPWLGNAELVIVFIQAGLNAVEAHGRS